MFELHLALTLSWLLKSVFLIRDVFLIWAVELGREDALFTLTNVFGSQLYAPWHDTCGGGAPERSDERERGQATHHRWDRVAERTTF